MTLLEVEGLRLVLDGAQPAVLLDGVSFRVDRGERVALTGPSGAGKSVLARCLVGLPPGGRRARLTGSIRFEGMELAGMQDREWRRVRGAGIGLMLQEASAGFNPLKTVGSQVAELLRCHRRLNRKEARLEAERLWERVGLDAASAELFPHQLSGGMAQRASLAAALAPRPRLLIADEPTTGLDPVLRLRLLELLARVASEQGTALLFLSHDEEAVGRLCSRRLRIADGCLS